MQHDTHISRSFLSGLNEFFVYTMVVVVPLIFFPFIENTFDTAKYFWIIVAFIVAAITWSIHLFKTKEFSVKGHSFLIPQVVMIIAVVASAIFSPLRMSEDFAGIMGVGFFLSLWVLFASTMIKKINVHVFIEVLLSIAIVLSLISILQLMGVGPTLILNKLFGFQFAEKFQFSPTGSPLVTLTFLIPILVATITEIVSSSKWSEKIFEMVGSAVILLTILVHAFLMFPGKPDSPVTLPFSANWVIAVENLKTWNYMLIGTGPNSFSETFTINRPVQLNATLLWNVLFQTGSNTPLTLLVSLGLIGLFAWAFNALQAVRTAFSSKEHLSVASLVLSTFIIQLIFPPNIVLLTLQAAAIVVWIVSLGMSSHRSVKEMVLQFASLKLKHESNQELSLSPVIAFLVGCLTLAGTAIVIFSFGKNMIAEYFFVQALKAAAQNDGQKAYTSLQQTLRFNPERDSYHRTYAQTNYALANAISTKEDITDEDRSNVAQLMQQAIRESRIAAGLNPQRSINWKVMAEVYRSLIGSVEKADQFTVAAYVQAIQLFPTEPSLRVDLGGVFLNAKNYDQAAQLFEQAARLKPDYPNAYYNWGKALEGMQRYEPALAAYKQALSIVSSKNPESEQIELLKKEIDAVQAKVPTPTPTGSPQQRNAQTQPSITPTPSPTTAPIPSEPESVEPPASTGEQRDLLDQEPDITEETTSSSSATPTP